MIIPTTVLIVESLPLYGIPKYGPLLGGFIDLALLGGEGSAMIYSYSEGPKATPWGAYLSYGKGEINGGLAELARYLSGSTTPPNSHA